MSKEEFVETIIVNNRMVNVGVDDYGQCYFFEYYDEESRDIKEMTCGTYNLDYRTEIQDYFDIIDKKKLNTPD